MAGHTKHNTPKFVALGGIWLDEICSPGKETLFDVPGGSVAFGKTYFTYIEQYFSGLTLSTRQLHLELCCTLLKHLSPSDSSSKLDMISPKPWNKHSNNGTWTYTSYVEPTSRLQEAAYSTARVLLSAHTNA